MADSEREGQPYRRELVIGALFNTLGLAGKGLHLVFLWLATWLYGAEAMAAYLVCFGAVQVVGGFAISGYTDATTLFGSTSADQAESGNEEKFYDILANGLAVPVLLSAVIATVATLISGPVVGLLFPSYPALKLGLPVLLWSLCARAVADISIAGTKAHLRMEFDALVKGFVFPVSMITYAAIAAGGGEEIERLFYAQLLAECTTAVAALIALSRFASLPRLLRHLLRLRPNGSMFRFSAPQSVSLTLHTYITQIDVLMLAGMGVNKVLVAWYATAAQLTRELRQIRIVFASALAPVFARQHARGQTEEIEHTLGRLSRWTTTLVVAVGLPVLLLRDDILQLYSADYSGDSTFVAILLLVPLINCAIGLSGNALVYSGRTDLSLVNNLVIAAFNSAANWLLIPHFGLLGAATATVSATVLVNLLQVVQLRRAAEIRWQWATTWQPLVGLVLGAATALAVARGIEPLGGGWRALFAVLLPLEFFVIMLGLRHPEVVAVVARVVGRRRADEA